MKIEKQCVVCGSAFSVPPCRERSAKTCSTGCRNKLTAKRYAEQRVTLACKACGKDFDTPKCHVQRRIYCSRKCADAATRLLNKPKGASHYAWKGGITRHTDGYMYVLTPGYPNMVNNYVFQHRLVMEGMLCSAVPSHKFLVEIDGALYLRPEIEVHHINGVRDDNRPNNLLACTGTAHKAIHDGRTPKADETWPDIPGRKLYDPIRVECKCRVCGTAFTEKRSVVARGGGKYCSRKCYRNR